MLGPCAVDSQIQARSVLRSAQAVAGALSQHYCVDSEGFINYADNRYSAPWRLIGQMLPVRILAYFGTPKANWELLSQREQEALQRITESTRVEARSSKEYQRLIEQVKEKESPINGQSNPSEASPSESSCPESHCPKSPGEDHGISSRSENEAEGGAA